MKSVEIFEELIKQNDRYKVKSIKKVEKTNYYSQYLKLYIKECYSIITSMRFHDFVYHLYLLEDNSWLLECFGLGIPITFYQAKLILECKGDKYIDIKNGNNKIYK